MYFDYDPADRHLPQTELHGLAEMDAEADRVRQELGWSLAAFIGVFDADLEWLLFVQMGDYASQLYGGRPWGLPGGGVQPDEAPSNAVLRELEEETGLKLDANALLPAGWFATPYYQPHWRDHCGEVRLLYAAIADPDSPLLRPAPPETEIVSFFPFNLESLMQVPETGNGEHVLQPLRKHWVWWGRACQRTLENQLRSPEIWTYQNKEQLREPPWAIPPSFESVVSAPDGLPAKRS